MSKHQIIAALKALYPHCKHYMTRTPDQLREYISGYLGVLERKFGDLDRNTDVGGWVSTVCTNWLDRLGEHDHRFPSPDQVRDYAALYDASDRDKDRPDNEPWRVLTAFEYDSLTLAGKRRHCLILADIYAGRAGPMHVKGKGDGAVFPERFARFRPAVERCQAEAARLGKLIQDAKNREAPLAIKGRTHFDDLTAMVFERSQAPS